MDCPVTQPYGAELRSDGDRADRDGIAATLISSNCIIFLARAQAACKAIRIAFDLQATVRTNDAADQNRD
jgi:hypothetical protein